MRLIHAWLLLGGAAALLPAPARAWDEQSEDDRGRKLAESQLVRTADLPADPLSLIPFPWGNDALDDGQVAVRARRLAEVRLQGAPPGVTYGVQFCQLANSPARCSELGRLQTNADGFVNDVVPFPATGNPWTGFFVLVRDGKTMFVSGFAFPPVPPTGGAAVSVEGKVATVNPAAGTFSLEGFTPLIRVDGETRFTAHLKLEDLHAGMEVAVEGATQAGGSLLATLVRAKRGKP